MLTPTADSVWRDPGIARNYLEGVRGAIPGAGEQIDVMLRVAATVPQGIRAFVDLGCGDGILGAAMLAAYPDSKGIFLDFSDEMVSAARNRLSGTERAVVHATDYGSRDWMRVIQEHGPFDAVISGFSIHHQPDERKYALYEEIFSVLASGGVFVNIEHVLPSSELGAGLFVERFIDAMYESEQEQGGTRSRAQIAEEFHARQDRGANILAPVEIQCDWLRRIGYSDVDCFFKLYELAVFAGRRPV